MALQCTLQVKRSTGNTKPVSTLLAVSSHWPNILTALIYWLLFIMKGKVLFRWYRVFKVTGGPLLVKWNVSAVHVKLLLIRCGRWYSVREFVYVRVCCYLVCVMWSSVCLTLPLKQNLHKPQSRVTVIISFIAKCGAVHKLPFCLRTQPGPKALQFIVTESNSSYTWQFRRYKTDWF